VTEAFSGWITSYVVNISKQILDTWPLGRILDAHLRRLSICSHTFMHIYIAESVQNETTR